MAKNGIPNSSTPVTQHVYIQAGKPSYSATKDFFGRTVQYVPAPQKFLIPIVASKTVIHVPKGWKVEVIKNPVMYYPPMAAPQTAIPAHNGHYQTSNSHQHPQQPAEDTQHNEYNRLWQQDAPISQPNVLDTVATSLRPALQKKGFTANTVSEAKTVIQNLKNDMGLETIRHVEELVHSIKNYEQYNAFRSQHVPQASKANHHTADRTETTLKKIANEDISDDPLRDQEDWLNIAGKNIFDSEEPTESVATPAATSMEVIDDPTLAELSEITYHNDTIDIPAASGKSVSDPASILSTPPQETRDDVAVPNKTLPPKTTSTVPTDSTSKNDPTTIKTTTPAAPILKKTLVDQHADKTLSQSLSTKTKPEIPPKPEHLVGNFVKTKTTIKQTPEQTITPNNSPEAPPLPETITQPQSSALKTSTQKTHNQSNAETQPNSPSHMDNQESEQVISGISGSVTTTQDQDTAVLQTGQAKAAAPQPDSRPPVPHKSLLVKFKGFISQLFHRQSKTDADLTGIGSSTVKSPSSLASNDATDIADLTSLQEAESSLQEADYKYDDDGWDPDEFDDVDESTEISQSETSPPYENLPSLNEADNPLTMTAPATPITPSLNTDTDTTNNPGEEQGSSMSSFEASIKAAAAAREQRRALQTTEKTTNHTTAAIRKTNPPESPNEPPPLTFTETSSDSKTELQPEKNTDVGSDSTSQTGISKTDVKLSQSQEPKDSRALMLEAIREKKYNLNPVEKAVAPPNNPTDIRSTINTDITARRGSLAGNPAEEIEDLFNVGYSPDRDSKEAKELIKQVQDLIQDQSGLEPELALQAAQKIFDLDNKTVGEIEEIIDEMRG